MVKEAVLTKFISKEHFRILIIKLFRNIFQKYLISCAQLGTEFRLTFPKMKIKLNDRLLATKDSKRLISRGHKSTQKICELIIIYQNYVKKFLYKTEAFLQVRKYIFKYFFSNSFLKQIYKKTVYL